jgi:hypothetical protein
MVGKLMGVLLQTLQLGRGQLRGKKKKITC